MDEVIPTTPPPSASDTLTCPNCRQEITYYDVPGSYYYGCPRCHHYFEYENEGPPNILKTFLPPQSQLVLPIGTEGYLNGTWLRVVGYIYRKEQKGPYYWSEYALLDRDGQYTMLAEYHGHWTYIRKAPEQAYKERRATAQAYYIDAPERQYRLFNRYEPETLYAVGEFDWNILDDDKLSVSEYIHPPYVLTREKHKKQTEWYLGEYKTPKEIATAFGLSMDTLPARYDIGANQPSPVDEKWRPLVLYGLIALLALVVGQMLLSLAKPESTLFHETYNTPADTGKQAEPYSFKPIVTSSFEVKGPTMLAITLSSLLDNQWAEIPVTLINEQNGKAYSFTKVIEYYNGVEDGESWTEGSREEEANLSRILSGRYHLNVYPFSGNKEYLNLSVTVKQANPISNVLIIAILISLYLLLQYFRRRWFEYSRWSNSDYSDIQTD